jgi:DNA-binding CsgD family transcriptional regulator/predicted ATPase
VAAILRSPAVALFAARAAAVQPGFAVTPDNAAAVAALCRLLDGLPLAIEVAALWVGTLPVQTILARLTEFAEASPTEESPLDLLSDGYRDVAGSGQIVRAALASCYEALTPEERALLRRLAVFDGDIPLSAVEASWSPSAAGWSSAAGRRRGSGALRALRGLVSQGLLRRATEAHPPRFRMLRLVRAFALERLAAEVERDTARVVEDGRRGTPLLAAPTRPLLPPPPPAPDSAALSRLSPRERVVLRHVAAGLSNRDVARELSLSERTVAHHLTAIFTKLGVESRTAAAAVALRSGLT